MATAIFPQSAAPPAEPQIGTIGPGSLLVRGRTKLYTWMLALFVSLALGFSVVPIWHSFRGDQRNKDYALWYATGRVVLKGGEIYPKDPRRLFPFMYPPSCAMMLAIASTLGEQPFVIGLTILNTAAWFASILSAVYLTTGQALRRHPLLYILPSAFVLPNVHDTYLIGQPNLLLLACMLGAFTFLRLGREWAAGSLIALAAAVKAFPILAVCYLVYRRRWKATIALLATLAVLLAVLPLPFRGAERAWDDLVTWTKGMVLKYDANGIAQRPERCYSFKNQSMIALANRLLRSIPADGEQDQAWKVNLADLNFKTVNAVIAAAGLALCVFYVVAMPKSARRTPRTDAIEYAMLLLLILLFSPLSFNYFFVWLLYPFAVALSPALEGSEGGRGHVARWAWISTAVAMLALAIPLLRPAQAYGNIFFASLLLLIGLGFELRRAPAPAA